ncbi:hypothetical protein FZI85_11100 [Mycobacterium sp. CBMA293]|uniref:hypothetical protein n=1 Tax=unclassified Mycolicibacterium TaxID=2636767 RepID=UPI0012DCE36C|nr:MULTISPECIES: hypothetical protein [unclassified Mycolicibacterium]MUL46617.1 hypothetical protein [Mycolicibacterium sp. CBMA 360]MUL59082.1 hypothetical protein [Mycolicibacterium sp. CBMA 335]MUL69476.1 hypothetical protein [Mycolicibacterium sp. CBMA 311]MUL94440.1 hypothetical protein [Mycolicibacterium sp. CBMA 230]MUM06543.1 hypothetical protein [Mycolicibacterium sp. CBMA 213]
MLPRSVSGNPAGGQDVLDGLPGGLVNERVVLAVEKHAFETDLAFVVGLGQHAVDLCVAEWLAAVFEGFAGGEASLFQRVAERGDAPVPGGVLDEGPLDVRCSDLIHHDALHIGAVDAPGGIEVADRSLAGGTTAANLLFQAFLGFGGQILRVKLCKRRHNAVH